jgi:TolB-like protein
MLRRNAAIAREKCIEFRVGINVGDIIIDDDDVFGDDVNIAARLEGLAQPGGICVSRAVRDHVRGKLQRLTLVDQGSHSVKNIERPIRVFAIAIDEGKDLTPPRTAYVIAPDTQLSIVVLPFANLSNDPEQEYFADGLVEDLTTDLSRIAGSFVIARNTAFTYKAKAVNAKEIGRELGVNYMLEGSVRRLGHQVRINAQLIDARTGGHLWADRFDGDVGDLFALQDAVTSNLATAVKQELISSAARYAARRTNPDSVDLVLRGRAAALRPRGRSSALEAISFFEQALGVAPESVEAKIGLAEVLAGMALSLISSERTPTSSGPTNLSRRRWSNAAAAHAPITSKAKSCAAGAGRRRRSLNTRRRSRSIATSCPPLPIWDLARS